MFLSIALYVFLGCVAIQFIFYVFYFSRLTFYKKQAGNSPDPQPVSVVVCALNEAENLRSLLPALFRQEHPEFEVVVVNNCSTDATGDVLASFLPLHHNLRVVQVDNIPKGMNPKKYGLTLGIRAAKNDIILLTDADCTPQTNHWITAMSAYFDEKTQIVLGYSQYIKTKSLLNSFIRFETLYTGLKYITSAIKGNPYMGVGRNMAYRKSFFMEKKGFNNMMKITGGDDDLFVNKNGTKENTKVAVGEDCLVVSVPKKNIGSYYKQKKRHLYAGKFYRSKDKIRLAILSLSHVLFWVSLITLAILGVEPLWIAGGVTLRFVTMYIIFHTSAKKLGDRFKILSIPVLDFIYVFYYIRTGLAAAAAKEIKWN